MGKREGSRENSSLNSASFDGKSAHCTACIAVRLDRLTCEFSDPLIHRLAIRRGFPDQLDERGVLAVQFDFLPCDPGAVGEGADSREHLVNVLAGFSFVDVLQADVDFGLGLHVWDGAGEGEDIVVGMESLYSVCDGPEIGLGVVLFC